MNVVSLFAGVGGIDYAFKKAGFDIIYANDLDKSALKTYKLNFNNEVSDEDIRNIKDFPKADVLCGSFPHEPFSLGGKVLGFSDPKYGDLFFEMVRAIDIVKPRVIFIESVRNLPNFKNGEVFNIMLKELESRGYDSKYEVLNAKDYGVLQNRSRLYLVAFKNYDDFDRFIFPNGFKTNKNFKNFLYLHKDFDKKYYYDESFKHYDKLKEGMIDKDAIYQWRRSYVRKNKSNLCPTLTASMGTGGNNVPLIIDYHGRFRKLTPRECFNFQSFPITFSLAKVSDIKLYKQCGNTVAMKVVYYIAKEIMAALNE